MALPNTPLDFTTQWLAQQPRLNVPTGWQGGWERWAQGQIALFAEGNNDWVVDTEQRIYKDNTKEAADLVIRKPNVGRHFVELKCYSDKNNEYPNDFVKRVLIDYDQVHKDVYANLAGSQMWVVAIIQGMFRDEFMKLRDRYPHWAEFGLTSVDRSGTNNPYSALNFDVWYMSVPARAV